MTTLDDIRDCLEGMVPGVVATCSADGVPNVCYLSQVEYVSRDNVALSFQFFNKTRQNILANPFATVAVVDPVSGVIFRLALRYLRTEVHGDVFERMKAKLASIASASGTTDVFRLQGSDIYRVEEIERLIGPAAPKPPTHNRLSALRAASDELARARDVGGLIDTLLGALARHFGVEHAMLLAVDETNERFYTLASRGYPASGVGSEIPFGVGAVGIAAARRTPIRLAHASADYAYVRAIRENAARDPLLSARLENAIAFPGLPAPHSQLTIPIEIGERLLGVLHLESSEVLRFSYEDEDALVALTRQLGQALSALSTEEEAPRPAPDVVLPDPERGVIVVRHFAANDSVFLGEDYLIKGVAGAIFWRVVTGYVNEGRVHFSNRELRVDPVLKLPAFADNLEARLVLLERRLRERDVGIRLEKSGRGRFRLATERRLVLEDVC